MPEVVHRLTLFLLGHWAFPFALCDGGAFLLWFFIQRVTSWDIPILYCYSASPQAPTPTLGRAHPRPPRAPHLRGAAAPPPHPSLKSASSLSIYWLLNKDLIKKLIHRETRGQLKGGVWGRSPLGAHPRPPRPPSVGVGACGLPQLYFSRIYNKKTL